MMQEELLKTCDHCDEKLIKYDPWQLANHITHKHGLLKLYEEYERVVTLNNDLMGKV